MRNNPFPERIIGENKTNKVSSSAIRKSNNGVQRNSPQIWRRTLARRRSAASRGAGGVKVCALRCVKIHTVQVLSRETLIRVQRTFFFFLLLLHRATGWPFAGQTEQRVHLQKRVAGGQPLSQFIECYCKLYRNIPKCSQIFSWCWTRVKSLPFMCWFSIDWEIVQIP